MNDMRDPFARTDTIDWERIPLAELSRWYEQQRLTPVNHPRASIPYTAVQKVPAARISRVAALTHTGTGTYQTIAFDTAHFDTNGMWTAGSPTGFTIQQAGIYRFSGHVLFAAFAGAISEATKIQINGVDAAQHDVTTTAGAFDGMPLHVTAPVVAGDFVRLVAFQASGGNLAYNAGSPFVYFQADWVTPL